MKRRNKYIAVFVVKSKDSFKIAGTKRLTSTSKTIKFKKGVYLVDINEETYSKGLKLYYYIDVAGNQLKVGEKKKDGKSMGLIAKSYDPEVLDMFVAKQIISQLTANLSDNALKLNVITAVAGAIMGGLVGYIIAGVI